MANKMVFFFKEFYDVVDLEGGNMLNTITVVTPKILFLQM